MLRIIGNVFGIFIMIILKIISLLFVGPIRFLFWVIEKANIIFKIFCWGTGVIIAWAFWGARDTFMSADTLTKVFLIICFILWISAPVIIEYLSDFILGNGYYFFDSILHKPFILFHKTNFYESTDEHEDNKKNTASEEQVPNEKKNDNQSVWFTGVTNEEELKKRYKDLLKIYHPDNQTGDTKISQQIQREYEYLVKQF